MIKSLQSFIDTHELIKSKDELLLAVSGGKDSVVMAKLFKALDYRFAIAHCNFKLRAEESEKDEAFVKTLAQQLGVPFFSKSFETNVYAKKNSLSVQMAARDLRYKWFNFLCRNEGFDKILTAHHKDDAIETLLIKKSRKASLGALQGIPLQNSNIVRPMLCFNLAQIQDFIDKNSIEYREDKSNSLGSYERNIIRKDLRSNSQKEKQEYLKEIDNNKLKYNQLINKYETYKSNYCFKKDKGIFLSFEYILDQEDRQEILYEFLKYYGPFNWPDLFSLLDSEVGRQVSNLDYRIIRQRGGLYLSKIPNIINTSVLITNEQRLIESPIHLSLSLHEATDFILERKSSFAALDYDKLHFPLLLRPWKKGDTFTPLGMIGTKKVSDYLIDEKFTTFQKENTWVICSLNTIVCIVGHRINDKFKLAPETEKVYLVKSLKMEYGK